MYINRLYPLKTSAYEEMDQSKRCNSGSLSESDECRKIVAMDKKKDGKKHRRGRKRNRPRWKPYAKMSEEERKTWDMYEQSRMAQKERKLAVMSRRPVAPFNTTQFLMEDRTDSAAESYKPHPSEINRCVSFDSSTSGRTSTGVAVAMANSILSFSPPLSEKLSPIHFPPLSPSPISLGDESFEPAEDDSFQEQDAFLEADFNQVYDRFRLDRLEMMSKQDLVQECCSLEDRIATIEQERMDLRKEVQELNRRLSSEDHSKVHFNPMPVSMSSS